MKLVLAVLILKVHFSMIPFTSKSSFHRNLLKTEVIVTGISYFSLKAIVSNHCVSITKIIFEREGLVGAGIIPFRVHNLASKSERFLNNPIH
jgi:hypothetical protein